MCLNVRDMHFKIILDDSSAGDLTAAYHITEGDLDKIVSKVNNTSDILNMNIWLCTALLPFFEHYEVFRVFVSGQCCPTRLCTRRMGTYKGSEAHGSVTNITFIPSK